MSRAGRFLVLALLSAAAVGCQDNALRSAGLSGGSGGCGHPSAGDAGVGDTAEPLGDASSDRLAAEVTLAPLGTVCTGSAGCQSGFCVDGICCSSACAGGCQSCAAPGAVGTCLERVAGAPPRLTADCPVDAPAACGLDGTCDGAGACRLYLGTACVSGVCANGAVTGGGVCDGQGSCRPGPTFVCVPYDCDPATARCKTSCASDGDCFDGQHCHSGTCGDPPARAVQRERRVCVGILYRRRLLQHGVRRRVRFLRARRSPRNLLTGFRGVAGSARRLRRPGRTQLWT